LQQDGVIPVVTGRLNTSEVLTAVGRGASLRSSIVSMGEGGEHYVSKYKRWFKIELIFSIIGIRIKHIYIIIVLICFLYFDTFMM